MAEQNFSNHTRWYPLVHFVLFPLLLVLVGYEVVQISRAPALDHLAHLLLIVAVALLSLAARLQALKAQDRVIRLEERLRYSSVLTPELANRASALRTGQMIALRFAPDEELANLVERTLNGEFATNKDIKRAIGNWRPDYLRV